MSIKGETLGEKHKQFNKLVQDLLDQNPDQELDSIDFDQPDIDNFLKIDIACHTKNVEFLLSVFKCKDMLYVSRAIKHSAWLVQDPQYAYIINPEYLHSKLFPYMLTEALKKLLLHIRLNLKDPARCEEFFKYLVEVDLNAAMKWLPNCSVPFISSRLEQDIYRIPKNTILRLLWVTMDTLRIYVKSVYWKRPILQKSMFCISKHGEEYFDILDTIESGQLPTFNSKYTKLVMKKCPHRLMRKFDRYGDFIDGTTFVNYMRIEAIQEFRTTNASNKKVSYLFPEEKYQNLLKLQDQNKLLKQLLECDPNKTQEIKEILQSFRDSYRGKKFRLHFLSLVFKKFHTHRFNDDLWRLLSDIYNNIDVNSQNKPHFRACLKSIITYKIFHNETVPKDALLEFLKFGAFKSEQNKLNEDEKNKMFDFLYNAAASRLELCTDNNDLLTCLESVLTLIQAWGKNWKDFPLVANKVELFIKLMKDTSNIEELKILYRRKRVWRIILFNESFLINPHEDACINALKHDPQLLHSNEESVIALCSKDNESMNRFFGKLRIYWSDSLAKTYKNIFLTTDTFGHLHAKPLKGLFKLLSRKELSHLIHSNMPKNDTFKWGPLEQSIVVGYVIKNMYRVRPKPSIDEVLSYSNGIYTQDALSSLKSVLHSLPAQQTINYVQLQEWPEFVQKLCVFQTFAKFKNKEVRNRIISNIWNNTIYSSVRADIFKISYKSLKKFNKNDMNSNKAYNSRVEDEWTHLKLLMESLTVNESVVIYNLLSRFEQIPLVVRAEYCIIGYKILKNLLPRSNCRKFMNKIVSKIEHNHVLPSLELDFIAEMVNDTIIKRLWTEKLDWTFMHMLFVCVSSPNEKAKQIEAFEKVLAPVLENAYKIWDRKTQGIFMVRYNIYKLISAIGSYKDMFVQNKSIILHLLLDSFQRNLSIKENYVLITKFRLAVEYCKVLSNIEISQSSSLYENTTLELGKICIKMFCEDVASYSASIWILFFHALQMMLNSFCIKKPTQYKMCNNMLDLSKDLSPELDILVHNLVLEHIYYVEYGNEDKIGRRALRTRIEAHPSPEVKAQSSKLMLTDCCTTPYYSLFY